MWSVPANGLPSFETEKPKMSWRFNVARASPEQHEPLATHDGWELHARPPGREGWKNFVLVSPASVVEKRKFWLGHDGTRFAQGRDLAILYEHHRPIYEWLERLFA
jgi:hypothetical protein